MRVNRQRSARSRGLVHLGALAAAAIVASSSGALADDPKHELPPGPIHDRHELMEGVGANAKKIGAAAKAGKPGDAQVPAEEIAQALAKFVGMFPKGSESPLSRAKPAVWTEKAKFDELAKKNEQAAMALAAVAKSGGDLKAPSGAMFQTCKACHDEFRVPKEGE
jgi:cytochrome c556